MQRISVTWKFAKAAAKIFSQKKGETPARTEELESSPPKSWVTCEIFSVFSATVTPTPSKAKGTEGQIAAGYLAGDGGRFSFPILATSGRCHDAGKGFLRESLFKATRKRCRGQTGSFTESGAAHETIRCSSGGPGTGGIVSGLVLTY